jgi:pre-mRNA-splicing factor ATP-dependent RNA helicase DHX15/PRP43
VGFAVRHDKNVGNDTRLIYMTDGHLLAKAVSDNELSEYACVIIDDAHERTVATDVLMAILKSIVTNRSDFKVVIMSATLDAKKFQDYFGNAPRCHIAGRSHKVDINYLRSASCSYFLAATATAEHIHSNKPPGDILVFLTGEDVSSVLCYYLISDLLPYQAIDCVFDG